jgi:hypothetical protein
MLFFVTVMTAYLAVIGYALIKCLRRRVGKDEVLLATASAYGLALLLLFVNRSHPYNLYHPAVPFAVVLVALMFTCRKALASVLRHSCFPYLLTGGLTVFLLTKAQFLNYPSVLRSFFDIERSPNGGLSLMSNPTDISGLPPEAADFVREFNDVTSAIRAIARDGGNVAILDFSDTLLYHAANVRPWSRYASLLPMVQTKESLDYIRKTLLERPPKWVVIPGENSSLVPASEAVWRPLYEDVKARYVLRQTVGVFEIWVHPDQS